MMFSFISTFQVPVRSILDFQKLYVGFSSSKLLHKTAIEHPRRGHRGLIVHISSSDNNLRTGKMNFVDLAGCCSDHVTIEFFWVCFVIFFLFVNFALDEVYTLVVLAFVFVRL